MHSIPTLTSAHQHMRKQMPMHMNTVHAPKQIDVLKHVPVDTHDSCSDDTQLQRKSNMHC